MADLRIAHRLFVLYLDGLPPLWTARDERGAAVFYMRVLMGGIGHWHKSAIS